MPEMILPSGEYAMVAHPTDWAKRPFILVDGQWYNFNSRQGVAASRSSEPAVREAILNDGYRPVFFGLKIERPEPASVTFTYTSESATRMQDWFNQMGAAANEASAPMQDFGDSIESNHTSYSNYTYERQMEAYQRWIGQRAQVGRVTGGYVTPRESLADRGTRVHLSIADEVQSSYGASQTIPNPYHDDTTRRYPTSEQVTSRRRR